MKWADDTHRWTSGMKFGFARLAAYYGHKDPAFASEMMAAATPPIQAWNAISTSTLL